ncbi:MAG: FG-GAP-like repeat-containing protein [Candidatus Eisenbacteria bacterium]
MIVPRPTSRSFRPLLLSLIALALGAASASALPFTTTARYDYPVGNGPVSSVVADVNSDGLPDVITANGFNNTISVLINGPGLFYSAVNYPVGDRPSSVAAWDLNYDGFMDLMVANYNDSTVSVMMGNGTGAFPTRTDYPSGTSTTSALVANINGDQYPDLVTTSKGNGSVGVRLGTVSGTFGPRTNYPVGAWPLYAVARDLNGDGLSDIVTANFSSNSFSVLLSNGAGGLQPRVDYALNGSAYGVALGYFNADNKLDVAVSNQGQNRINVFLGDGMGGFGSRTDLITGSQPKFIAAGDVNMDGKTDLVVSNAASSTVSVLFGDGNGGFAPKVDFAVASSPNGVSIVDATGDGEPDLIACGQATSSVTILKGNLPGGFAVGDTLVDVNGTDQVGALHTLSSGAGKWRFVDVCAAWCSPCFQMSRDARQVCDTWANVRPLPFEYLTILAEGEAYNSLSTITDAANWAARVQLNSPVLNKNAARQNVIGSWVKGLGVWAYPTWLIVDPAGKIRERSIGAIDGQTIVDKIAGYAAIAPAPTLAAPLPPLPPPPPPNPRVAWQALSGVSIELQAGAGSWTSPLGAPVADENIHKSFIITPTGVPGVPGQAYIQVDASTDSTTGLEDVWVYVGTNDLNSPIQQAQPWQVKLTNLTWPDGQARVLAPSDLELSVAYPNPSLSIGSYQPTAEVPVATYSGNVLSFSPFTLANMANVPASTHGFLIGPVRFKHQIAVAGVLSHGSVASLATPWPNPTRSMTNVRWAMAREGRAQVSVMDLGGRLVRTLHDGVAAAGEQSSRWDLRDESNARVAPGLYFVRFEAPGEVARTTRLVVME